MSVVEKVAVLVWLNDCEILFSAASSVVKNCFLRHYPLKSMLLVCCSVLWKMHLNETRQLGLLKITMFRWRTVEIENLCLILQAFVSVSDGLSELCTCAWLWVVSKPCRQEVWQQEVRDFSIMSFYLEMLVITKMRGTYLYYSWRKIDINLLQRMADTIM